MSTQQVIEHKFFLPSIASHSLTMSTAHAAVTSKPLKDPSKMSKGELLCLYKTTVAEKDNIAGKYGQYPHVSHEEFTKSQ